jgi:DNA helicase MCM8
MADRAAAARQRLMQHSHSQATTSISTQAPCLPGSTQPPGGTSSQAGGTGRVTLMQRLKLMGGGEEAPLPPQLLRKYIAYARAHVMPVLSDEAKDVLQVGCRVPGVSTCNP